MDEPINDTQERELVSPDEPVSNEDTLNDQEQTDSGDPNDIQDAEILPLQADDNSEASMTMMRGESSSVENNGTGPNDLLVIGGVIAMVVLLTVMTVLLLKRKPYSADKDTESDEQQ